MDLVDWDDPCHGRSHVHQAEAGRQRRQVCVCDGGVCEYKCDYKLGLTMLMWVRTLTATETRGMLGLLSIPSHQDAPHGGTSTTLLLIVFAVPKESGGVAMSIV